MSLKGYLASSHFNLTQMELNMNMENNASTCKAKKALFTALRKAYFTTVTPLKSAHMGSYA